MDISACVNLKVEPINSHQDLGFAGKQYLFKESANEVKLRYARSALAFMLLNYTLDQRNMGLMVLMHITVHVNRGLDV